MKHLNIFLFLICFVGVREFSCADQYYPRSISVRLYGTDQGNVGDCLAQAQVGALEQAFVNRGVAVRFSLFHRHAFNWREKTQELQKEVSLNLNDADQGLLQKIGDFIPEYMWPEDTEGFSPRDTGMRPQPSDSIVWVDGFPRINDFSYQSTFSSFAQGFRNTSDLNGLKQAIASGHAVILSVHGAILMELVEGGVSFNRKTGLLSSKYSREAAEKNIHQLSQEDNFVTGMNHSVAVIGFDDSLYADGTYETPGAIIIRNSWNDSGAIQTVRSSALEEETKELKKFRFKLAPVNLPGYYAIPMQYIVDMQNATNGDKKGIGGFTTISMDYVSYNRTYLDFQSRYKTVIAPYACDMKDGWSADLILAKRKVDDVMDSLRLANSTSASVAEKGSAMKRVWDSALGESKDRRGRFVQDTIFKFAKIPVYNGAWEQVMNGLIKSCEA